NKKETIFLLNVAAYRLLVDPVSLSEIWIVQFCSWMCKEHVLKMSLRILCNQASLTAICRISLHFPRFQSGTYIKFYIYIVILIKDSP
ncbi:hypothetical protein ALC62_06095, partial [Cyphomyrmex costatus]